MKQNDEARQEPHPADVRADAVQASFAGPALYAATLTAALFEETKRGFDQWCSLSARFCYAGPVRPSGIGPSTQHTPVSTRADVSGTAFAEGAEAGIYPESADVDAFADVDDLPKITKEEMLAHPRSMEFNIALHEMQERLFAGEPMGSLTY